MSLRTSAVRGVTAVSAALLIATPLLSAPAAHAEALPVPDLTDGQWHLAEVGAPAAWSVSTGAGVTVAVLDSGIDASHPDLAPAVLPQALVAYKKDMPTISSRDLFDIVGHGTHVSGLIAGRADGHGVTGVAPDASILAVKILPDADTGISIDWAVQMPKVLAAAKAAGASVVNMSFGAGISETGNPAEDGICQGIAASKDLDLVLVAAAGNDGFDENKPMVPAMCDGVLSVGALDSDYQPAFFTSFNDQVDISAPGYNVLSSLPAAQASYGLESGTSMASPIVAGVAALVRSAHPDWSAQQVVSHLLATARDVYTPGHDVLTGAGVVDAAAALGLPATTAKAPAFALQRAQEGVRWRQPVQAVSSYQVTVTSHTTGQATYAADLPGTAVFAPISDDLAAPGDWVTLTAHLADGTTSRVVSFPFGPSDDVAPPEVKNLTVKPDPKNGGLLRAAWENDPNLLGFVVALLVDGQVRHTDKFSTEDGPLPTHDLLPAHLDPHHDYRVAVVGYGNTPHTSLVDVTIKAKNPVAWRPVWFGDIAVLHGHVAAHMTGSTSRNNGKVKVTITRTDGSSWTRTLTVVESNYGGGDIRVAVKDGDVVKVAGSKYVYRVHR